MKKDFDEQNKLGKIGENYFEKDISTELKPGTRLINVSSNDTLENFHVDFILADKNISDDEAIESIITKSMKGIKKLYEIKTDTEILNTRNMYFEVSSSANKLGWAFTTVADYLIYYGIDENENIQEGWKINVKKYREWFLDIHRLPKRGTWNGKCKTSIFKSAGRDKNSWLTSIDSLVDYGIAKRLVIKKKRRCKIEEEKRLSAFFSNAIGRSETLKRLMKLTGYIDD